MSNDDGGNTESTMLHNLNQFPTAVDFLNLEGKSGLEFMSSLVRLTSSRSLSITPFFGSFLLAHFLPGHCNIALKDWPKIEWVSQVLYSIIILYNRATRASRLGQLNMYVVKWNIWTVDNKYPHDSSCNWLPDKFLLGLLPAMWVLRQEIYVVNKLESLSST